MTVCLIIFGVINEYKNSATAGTRTVGSMSYVNHSYACSKVTSKYVIYIEFAANWLSLDGRTALRTAVMDTFR